MISLLCFYLTHSKLFYNRGEISKRASRVGLPSSDVNTLFKNYLPQNNCDYHAHVNVAQL